LREDFIFASKRQIERKGVLPARGFAVLFMKLQPKINFFQFVHFHSNTNTYNTMLSNTFKRIMTLSRPLTTRQVDNSDMMGKREKALEDMAVREHEKKLIDKLREEIKVRTYYSPNYHWWQY
jgi:HD superfamily phosphohydrolase